MKRKSCLQLMTVKYCSVCSLHYVMASGSFLCSVSDTRAVMSVCHDGSNNTRPAAVHDGLDTTSNSRLLTSKLWKICLELNLTCKTVFRSIGYQCKPVVHSASASYI